jgi:hypothetical protein
MSDQGLHLGRGSLMSQLSSSRCTSFAVIVFGIPVS